MAPTAPTASGDRWRASLILTVTRRCDLRCAYCPTAKDGEPDLSPADARRAIDLFVARYGGGDCKIFGGEPLLVPEVVQAVLDHAPPSVRVYLSTNGSHLDNDWLARIAAHPNVTLTVSLDGAPADHDGLRRGAPTYEKVRRLLPALLRLPRFVVTQTIAPSTAVRAGENFDHLAGLGVRRFNLLPGYYLPWSDAQLAALEQNFAHIADRFRAAWARGDRWYLRNLFTRAPTPFYNTGMVVDSDRRIHPSNLILADDLDHLRGRTSCGTLDDPPSRTALDARAEMVSALLQEALPEKVLRATAAADAALTRLCQGLYPAYFAMRRGP